MNASTTSLVTLKPARQAALQALMLVESSRHRGERQSSLPHVRTFLRVLTGSCRLNREVARCIPGLFRDPAERQSSLKQVEEALDVLIASRGERCPLPLPLPLSTDVQGELFPEVTHTRTDRLHKRERMAHARRERQAARREAHRWRQTQSLIQQAKVELNFQSPETVSRWYRRWSDEVDASRLLCAVWHWQTRFPSLDALDWLRYSDAPLYAVMYEIDGLVNAMAGEQRAADRWQVPDKLTMRPAVSLTLQEQG